MSIDPNKSFAMKATNRLYTLEFKKDVANGTTEVTAVDNETPTLSFGERFSIAWAILTGKKKVGECVFPFRLRNSDLYNMSYIHRPEKVVEKIVEKIVEVPAKTVKATVAASKPVQRPKDKKPSTPRAPRKPKTETAKTEA